ncbi:MAG: 30S ribosomal protein S6 [Sorangiineae bacterium]|nr:30S ribosomal protein S6 [Polyangiaceae bacterium]MEB2322121.1 30S ribosomal protein S6 [Sorangiineae bacterium]
MADTQASAQSHAREYETIYVMRPDLAKEATAKVARRVEEVVGREGGRLTLVETWGRRQLAYPVAKFKRGVYVYVRYIAGGALVTELERNLRMLDEVMKFQTVLVRKDVELESVTVDPETVVFEEVEPPAEGEEEDESLERELGLVDGPERTRSFDGGGDSDDEDDTDMRGAEDDE